MELMQWNKIRTEIEEAKDIQTLSLLSDKLEAMRKLAKQSKQSLEVQNRIAEYRLRVERKKGSWLSENIKHKGGRPEDKPSTDSTVILKDIGITRDNSSDSQRIAKLSEKDFEEYIKLTKGEEEELTVSGAVKLSKQIIREDKIDEQKEVLKKQPPTLPSGKFDIIVIDPPWRYNDIEKYDPETRRGTLPYPSMKQEELLKLKIPSQDNCILWLWTTNTHIINAYELLETWGFTPKTILTWDKVNIGTGYWLRSLTEHCILAVKGTPLWTNKKYPTLIREKRTKHSKKPDSCYKIVDEICFGSKLDYFARNKRKGWQVYGDEIK